MGASPDPITCNECGDRNPRGAKYCNNCGCKIDEQKTGPAAAAGEQTIQQTDSREQRTLDDIAVDDFDIEPTFTHPDNAANASLTYWAYLSYLLGVSTILFSLLVGVTVRGFVSFGFVGVIVGGIYLAHAVTLPQDSDLPYWGGMGWYGLNVLYAVVTLNVISLLLNALGIYFGWKGNSELTQPEVVATQLQQQSETLTDSSDSAPQPSTTQTTTAGDSESTTENQQDSPDDGEHAATASTPSYTADDGAASSSNGLRGSLIGGSIAAGVLGLVAAFVLFVVTLTTGWFLGLVMVLPPVAAGFGMGLVVGEHGSRISGAVAAVIGLGTLFVGLDMIERALPPTAQVDGGGGSAALLLLTTFVIGPYFAYSIGKGADAETGSENDD